MLKRIRQSPIIIVYFIYAFMAIFIWYSLTEGESGVKVIDEDEKKQVEEIKPVKARLTVDTGTSKTEYASARLQTHNTVKDLFTYHRENNGFEYTKLDYNYGVVITSVNGLSVTETTRWYINEDGVDITDSLSGYELKHNSIYTLKLGIK